MKLWTHDETLADHPEWEYLISGGPPPPRTEPDETAPVADEPEEVPA